MSKINKTLVALVVVLVVALGGVLYWQKGGFEATYSAVYLNTGDLYFGQLSRFPHMTLHDVYFLQKSQDQQQPFGLSKFEKAFWGPEDEMVLNSENVIWTAELKADSPIVQAIKNPQVAQSPATSDQLQQLQKAASMGEPATTTEKSQKSSR